MHTVLFAIWTISSTIIYGLLVLSTGFFIKRFAFWVGRQWSRHLLFMGGVKVTVFGAENIVPGGKYVVISNHASAFDIPVLHGTLPLNIVFMAKKELFRIPVFGWGMSMIGHLPVDRSNARKARESIKKAVKKIQREDLALLLFPEGTRSVTGKLGEFKSASFALAIEAGVDILPVALIGTNNILRKKSWKINSGKVVLCIGKPIHKEAFAGDGKKELSAKVREAIEELILTYESGV